MRLRIFHVCRNENFRKLSQLLLEEMILYLIYGFGMVTCIVVVPCLPFPGLLHIYFLFTLRLTNERVGVFLARRSLQHLVVLVKYEDKICL